MSGNNNHNSKEVVHQEDRGVLEVIREIKTGTFDPKCLSPGDRQSCVMHLGVEGMSVAEIADVLKVSDRTVMRDRKAIQEANAIEHDPKLAGQFAGRLAAEAEVCVNRIRRVTRDKAAPHAERIEGERACFEILDKLAHRLQSMGFLPTAAQQVQADLTHHVGDSIGIDQICIEAQRLKQINLDTIVVEATPVSPATTNQPALPGPGSQDQGETNHDCTD